jgi:hypothetical protein
MCKRICLADMRCRSRRFETQVLLRRIVGDAA